MNSPPALLSMSARVSMISFSVFPLICIGIDREFDSILAVLTLKISRQGETDVKAVLLFKNPVLLILSKICLFLHHSCVTTSTDSGFTAVTGASQYLIMPKHMSKELAEPMNINWKTSSIHRFENG